MTDEIEALRATATELVRREVAPHLQEWEDAGEIPRELHAKAGELGLIGIAFPEEVGGERRGPADDASPSRRRCSRPVPPAA